MTQGNKRMIWDRFDDAHDDVLSDIRDTKNEIEILQNRLKTAGIEYPPFKPPESQNDPGPQGWYEDTQREESAYRIYRSRLQKLLETPASE